MGADRQVALLLDFDGTIATGNVGMSLIENFAQNDSWRVIDNDYLNSRVGSRTAYSLLCPLLAGTPGDWRDYALQNHGIDPGLRPLVQKALEAGWRVEILSDGLDLYIRPMMEREKIELPITSGLVIQETGGRTYIATPYINPLCGRCATCKTERILELNKSGYYVIFVGDGFSDLCAAPKADRIFAKDVLKKHLEEKNIAHDPFETLLDLIEPLFGAKRQAQKPLKRPRKGQRRLKWTVT